MASSTSSLLLFAAASLSDTQALEGRAGEIMNGL